ncbi:MAG: hypothetical protein HZC28_02495 [Spirochaetes bacterium]|nr:hypothetical protein [Spirochaetota bacterium]
MTCSKLAHCPFFNDEFDRMPLRSGILKRVYCMTAPDACARYQLKAHHEDAPHDLLPDGTKLAAGERKEAIA